MMLMNDRVLCCIFNHNHNDDAVRWYEGLSPYFETVILDSGSNPPCSHTGAMVLPNIYYSGLMNKAYELLKQKGCRWLMIVTSDIEIDSANLTRLVSAMDRISHSTNVALYQPCCKLSLHGRALPQSVCHFTGRMRCTNFQEGWFHMVCREILDEVLPIDTDVNKLGWGVDLALSHFARVHKMLVIVDDRVKVIHPKGTGYNRDAALAQMRQWHATISGYCSPRHFRPLKNTVIYDD